MFDFNWPSKHEDAVPYPGASSTSGSPRSAGHESGGRARLAGNLRVEVVASCRSSPGCRERWYSRNLGGHNETVSYRTHGGDEEHTTRPHRIGTVSLLGILGGSSRSNTPPPRPTRPIDVPRHYGYRGDLYDQQQGICRDVGPIKAEVTL